MLKFASNSSPFTGFEITPDSLAVIIHADFAIAGSLAQAAPLIIPLSRERRRAPGRGVSP